MASTTNVSDKTTIVVGASRGLGRGIATALAEAGAPVTAVARSATALDDLARAVSGIRPEVTDAGDPSVAGNLIDRYDPHALVLVAGATPFQRPLHHQTWETFSTNWHTDVRIAFHWCARRYSNRCGPAAEWSSSQAARHWGQGLLPAAGTRAPKPRSGSSPPTPRRKQTEPVWGSRSQPCSRASHR